MEYAELKKESSALPPSVIWELTLDEKIKAKHRAQKMYTIGCFNLDWRSYLKNSKFMVVGLVRYFDVICKEYGTEEYIFQVGFNRSESLSRI